MLDTLPVEVTFNIVNRLCFNEKLQLVKTCRKLRDLISTTCLYEEIKIGTGKKAVKIIEMFKSKKLDGGQVKRLSIEDLEELPDAIYDKLTEIFPNVTELLNPSGFLDYEEPRDYEPLIKWVDTIEECDMRTTHIQVICLLEGYTFSRLKYLAISPFTDFSERYPMFSITILDCIKHAPQVKELVVKENEINIAFLEKLHRNCKQVESLIFDTILFQIDDKALPKSIKPATNITYLELTAQTVIADTKGLLLDYIARKYTNLKQLVIACHFDESIIDYFMAAGYSTIEEEDYVDESAEVIEADYNATAEVYRAEGSSRLISHLPQTLEQLVVYQDLFNDMNEALKKSGCKAKLEIIKRRRYYGN